MKAKVKKWRSIKRVFGRVVRLILLVGAIFGIMVWLRPHYPKIEKYLKRFGIGRIDTAQADRYYDLLSEHARQGGELVLDLGVKDNDDLQNAVSRLKGVMGLRDYKIFLARHDADKPPGYINQIDSREMEIRISKEVRERREEMSVLVHELSHIYVWNLEESVFGGCDQEKLVDCAGIFLGLGIVILNGLTDETVPVLFVGEETRKKFYGYLKPEQFGYLFARYCAEHGVAEKDVWPFLNTAGRKYFSEGRDFLKKRGRPIRSSHPVKYVNFSG